MREPRGFTLVEVAVAVVLLEVGLLAAGGTVLLARQILARAERIERAAADASALVDSLLEAGGAASGEVEGEGYRLRWRRVPPGWTVDADAGGAPVFRLVVPWAP